jgi:hypothetical protein
MPKSGGRNLNNDLDYGFQALLYYKFIISAEHDVASVSQKMRISSDTLYRYVRRALAFPIDRLADLVNATGDIQFIEYFAKRCGYTLIPMIKDRKQAEMMKRMAEIFLSATGEIAAGGDPAFLRKETNREVKK